MSIQKTPLSITIIYWMTNIIFGLIALVGLAVIVFNILLYTDFFGNDLQLHTRLPVKMNILETGNLYLFNQNIQVELVDATSQIHFFNTPLFIARWFGTAMLMVGAIFFYLMFTFRKFIANVKAFRIFDIQNIQLLKNIAYALLLLWIFSIIYMRIMASIIVRNLEFKHVEFIEDYPNFGGLLLLSLFIWVLSHVLITGARLKEEQDLTI